MPGFNPAEIERRLSSGTAGVPPLEKTAVRFERTPEEMVHIGQQIQTVTRFMGEHPELLGGVMGGIYGAVMGGTGTRSAQEVAQDPHASLRTRLGSMVGGMAGGATMGRLLKGTMGSPLGAATGSEAMISAGASGSESGRQIASLFAPQTAVPKSVSDVLGKKQTYSDKAIFEKYWDEFGPELEEKGKKTELSDKPREEKYVSALRDLYAAASTHTSAPVPQSKKSFLLGAAAGMLMAPATTAARMTFVGKLHQLSKLPSREITAKSVMLRALPAMTSSLASTAKGYRDRYIDPGVTVENKEDAQARSKFDDEQLKKLLRGLGVKETTVKQHVIK